MRSDLISHPDILFISIMAGGLPINLIGIYSNNLGTGILHLLDAIPKLLYIHYLGGDFNCPSELWDPLHRGSSTKANNLLEASSMLGLTRAIPAVGSYTFFPGNLDLRPSVLDLVFSPGGYGEVIIGDKATSDHAPVLFSFALEIAPRSEAKYIKKGSDSEKQFLSDLRRSVMYIPPLNGDYSIDAIDKLVSLLSEAFSSVWDRHAKRPRISPRSKS